MGTKLTRICLHVDRQRPPTQRRPVLAVVVLERRVSGVVWLRHDVQPAHERRTQTGNGQRAEVMDLGGKRET